MSARWTFSLQLLGVYLATFHAWRLLERPGIVAVGLVSTGVLGLLFWRARQRGYFLNFWDGFWHATVILDVLLEGVFVSHHGDHSFYLCAAAFITVVGGYRLWLWRRAVGSPPSAVPSAGQTSSDQDHTAL